MHKPKVFIGQKIPKEVEAYIGKTCEYEMWNQEDEMPRSELLKKVQEIDGLILSGVTIDKELLDKAPGLKVVSNISVGYNNFDLKIMKERGIIGTHTPGCLDDTVADLIFGLMLSISRRIPQLDKYMRDGQWCKGDDKNLFGRDVHHRTIGIIGMGRIGEAVAKRAKLGFDMNVLYYNRNRKDAVEKSLGVNFVEFETLLQKSDFILLMAPLTKETYHLIDKKEFKSMKKDAFFINASRGQLVNEEALIEALKTNEIGGAGLDVYEMEPISANNPLLKLDNVVMVPHIGSATEKTRFDMMMLAAQNLLVALSKEAPCNVVPELLSSSYKAGGI